MNKNPFAIIGLVFGIICSLAPFLRSLAVLFISLFIDDASQTGQIVKLIIFGISSIALIFAVLGLTCSLIGWNSQRIRLAAAGLALNILALAGSIFSFLYPLLANLLQNNLQ